MNTACGAMTWDKGEANQEKLPAWADYFNDLMIDFWCGEILWNTSMADFSAYRVGGPAEAVIFPLGINELSLLVQGLRKLDVPWLVLGRGTNILVADEGLPGVVIILGHDFCSMEQSAEDDGTVLVRVKGGCAMAKLVNWCTDQELSGLEFAAGIPGSVGGATVMNAGAWGGQVGDVLHSVIIMDSKGTLQSKVRQDMNPSYRGWNEPEEMIAVETIFKLKKGDKAAIAEKCRVNVSLRKKQQPMNVISCGSFFKNPSPDKPAGQLIEEAGLKGFKIGNVMVSDKHANFIVNTGGANAADIVGLMRHIQNRVWHHSGIRLEPEVRLLGFVDL